MARNPACWHCALAPRGERIRWCEACRSYLRKYNRLPPERVIYRRALNLGVITLDEYEAHQELPTKTTTVAVESAVIETINAYRAHSARSAEMSWSDAG